MALTEKRTIAKSDVSFKPVAQICIKVTAQNEAYLIHVYRAKSVRIL